jgi:hypothetical protein
LAVRHAERALALGVPAPGLAHSLLACVAAARGDRAGVERGLRACADDPQHPAVVANARVLQRWLDRAEPPSGPPRGLSTRFDFQLLERTEQPMLPGPLPEGYDRFTEPPSTPKRP